MRKSEEKIIIQKSVFFSDKFLSLDIFYTKHEKTFTKFSLPFTFPLNFSKTLITKLNLKTS